MTPLHKSSTKSERCHSISIVIPVYNDPIGITYCLDAISKQSWPIENIEVIVIDNGSKPQLELAKTYPFNVRVLNCSTPGSYAARNIGAQNAEHDVLAFIDADCVPSPTWLEYGVKALETGKENHLVGGEVLISKPENVTAAALYQLTVGFQQAENILEKGFSATANLFCHRTQFLAIGPFDERLLSGGDREWCWRASALGYNIKFSEKAVVRTNPRVSLSGAVRQARRVAAGRVHLKRYKLTPKNIGKIKPHRSPLESTFWILRNQSLNRRERLAVFGVACTIKLATWFEILKLRFGSKPERR